MNKIHPSSIISPKAIIGNNLNIGPYCIIGEDVEIIKTKTDDNRSYHISSEKIKKDLNFHAKFTIEDAVKDLKYAFDKKLLKNTLTDDLYFNIKRMNNLNLK